MKKDRTLVAEASSIEDIMALAIQYEQAVKNYVSQFVKKTNGSQSMSDASYDFSVKCQIKKDLFPEILPGTFDVTDFDDKMTGLVNLNQIRKHNDMINKFMDEATKICKTDSKFYANEFYGMIKKEANRSAKYKTTVDELTVFYKKTASEKIEIPKLDEAKSN